MNPYEAASLFLSDEITECKTLGNGHVNETYLAVAGGKKYTVQKINGSVFHNVPAMMDNIVRITDHIAKKHETVTPVATSDGEFFISDTPTHPPVRTSSLKGEICGGKIIENSPTSPQDLRKVNIGGSPTSPQDLRGKSFWRVFTYVEGRVCERAETSQDLYTVGEGFGRFQRDLSDFCGELFETIPNFHNTPIRFQNFLQSCKEDRVGRLSGTREIAENYYRLKDLTDVITKPLFEGKIPLRVTHNDTKINNLVLDKESGRAKCVIDLDTVMNGSLLFDFGDAVRSGCNATAEDGESGEARLNTEYFEALSKGFFDGVGSITEEESKLLSISGAVLTYECGLRFLTDYLDGDVYFKVRYGDQNLKRAKVHLALCEDILRKIPDLERLTYGIFR